MEFENIHKVWNKFDKLHDAYGGIESYIEKGIEWDKVVWARYLFSDEYPKPFPVKYKKDQDGKVSLYLIKNGKEKLLGKKEFAYWYDLFDKDGKVLNIALFGC